MLVTGRTEETGVRTLIVARLESDGAQDRGFDTSDNSIFEFRVSVPGPGESWEGRAIMLDGDDHLVTSGFIDDASDGDNVADNGFALRLNVTEGVDGSGSSSRGGGGGGGGASLGPLTLLLLAAGLVFVRPRRAHGS